MGSRWCYPGEGLLIAGGSKWFRNRRLLTPAFHFEILRPYVQVYNDCASILLVRLLPTAAACMWCYKVMCSLFQSKWEKKAARGEPVPLYQDISQLTLDVVMRCAFSYYSNCQAEEWVHWSIKLSPCSCIFIHSRWWVKDLTPPVCKEK